MKIQVCHKTQASSYTRINYSGIIYIIIRNAGILTLDRLHLVKPLSNRKCFFTMHISTRNDKTMTQI